MEMNFYTPNPVLPIAQVRFKVLTTLSLKGF